MVQIWLIALFESGLDTSATVYCQMQKAISDYE